MCCTKFKTQGHLRDHMKRHVKDGNCACSYSSATHPTQAGSNDLKGFPVKLAETVYECSRCDVNIKEGDFESLKDSLQIVKYIFLIFLET